jgi:hypothetical protein
MDGRLTLGALVVALVAWIGAVLVAWPTYDGMNHATGTVAACADAALHGEAPGLSHGDAFLGTLYFPPVPLLVAGAHRLGMSWRAALRWVNLLGMLALMTSVALASQSLGGSGVGFTVALSLLLVSFPFMSTSIEGRADPWAAALSIGALAAWCRDPRRRGWTAPALAAAAWLVKATAVTVPLAVLISAATPGARRAAGPFAARYFAAVAAGVVLTIPWHGPGWYADVLHTLAFAPPNVSTPLRGPFELLRYLASYAELAVAAGLAIVYLTGEWSRGRPVRPYAVAALVLAMLVMTNRGSDYNHLLELTAVGAVGAGMWAEKATRREALLGTALVLMVVVGAAWREAQIVVRASRSPEARRENVIAAVRRANGPVLAEDPLVVLAAGLRPEIADASTMRSEVGRGDARAAAIVQRIASSHYDLIVLNENLTNELHRWYKDFQFGAGASETMAARYVLIGQADDFWLYRPAAAVKAAP